MVLLRRRIGLWPKAQPTRTAEATAVLREVCRKLSWVVGRYFLASQSRFWPAKMW